MKITTKIATKLATALIPFLALTGCNSDLNPSVARGDKYNAEHVVFSGQDDLVDHVAIGTITRTFDAVGILHVTVPARFTLPNDGYVDYRFTYFDENHNVVDAPSAWQTQTLHSNVFEYIQSNASTPRARDFQIDFRPAQ